VTRKGATVPDSDSDELARQYERAQTIVEWLWEKRQYAFNSYRPAEFYAADDEWQRAKKRADQLRLALAAALPTDPRKAEIYAAWAATPRACLRALGRRFHLTEKRIRMIVREHAEPRGLPWKRRE